MHWLTKYLQDIRAVEQTRADTEMSYRPAISELLKAAAAELVDDKLTILHEPQRQTVAGAPDYRIQNSGGGIVGYLECKAPGADLRALVKGSEQVEKYKNLSPNIMLTDGWNWLLLRNGEVVKEAFLRNIKNKEKTINKGGGGEGMKILSRFCACFYLMRRKALATPSGLPRRLQSVATYCASFLPKQLMKTRAAS